MNRSRGGLRIIDTGNVDDMRERERERVVPLVCLKLNKRGQGIDLSLRLKELREETRINESTWWERERKRRLKETLKLAEWEDMVGRWGPLSIPSVTREAKYIPGTKAHSYTLLCFTYTMFSSLFTVLEANWQDFHIINWWNTLGNPANHLHGFEE